MTTMSWLREVRVSVLLPTGLGALRVRKATHAVMNCSCGRRGAENTAHIHTHTCAHTGVHPPTWCSQHTHPPGVPDTPTWCSQHTHLVCTQHTHLVFPYAVHDPGVQLEVLALGGKAGQVNDKGELCVVEQGEEGLEVLHHIQDSGELGVILRGLRVEVPVSYRIAHQLTHHRRVRLGGGTTGSPSALIPHNPHPPTHSSSLPGKVQHPSRVGMVGHEEGDQEGKQLVLHGMPDGLRGAGEGRRRGGVRQEERGRGTEKVKITTTNASAVMSECLLPTLDCRTPKRRMSGQCFRGKLNNW